MNFFTNFPKVAYDLDQSGVKYNITDFSRYVALNNINFDSLSFYTYYEIRDGDRPDVVSRGLYDTPEYAWTFFVLNDHLKEWNGWPLSQMAFSDFIEEHYSGYAITLDLPFYSITDDLVIGDECTLIVDSNDSPAVEYVGTLHAKNINLNQIVVKGISEDVTHNIRQIRMNGTTVDVKLEGSPSYPVVVPYWNGVHHYENSDGDYVYDLTLYEVAPFDYQIFPVSYYEQESRLNDRRSKIQVIKQDYIYDFKQIYMDLINA